MSYSPNLGRWLEEDPIGFAGGDVNWYRFEGNNPVNRLDPTGLAWYDWIPGSQLVTLPYEAYQLYAATSRSRELDTHINNLPDNAGGPPVSTTPDFLPTLGQAIGQGGTDGAAMVANAATFHQITALNNYVDTITPQYGQAANFYAHLGVYSAYAAAAVGLWTLAGGPTWGIGAGRGPEGVHFIYGSTGWGGGPMTWYGAGGGSGLVFIGGAPSAYVGACSYTLTGVPILFPTAALGGICGWNCFTVAMASLRRGVIGF